MASSLKTPPELNDDTNYQDWKTDLEVWEMYTELPAKRKGPAVFLALQGAARDCLRELTPARIGSDNGFELICQKLDQVYLENVNYRAFTAFKNFYDFKRPSDMSIKDFVISYELLYHHLDEYGMTLPEGVQAFFILKAANVTEEAERMARVSCQELTYDTMKSTILRLFCEPGASNEDTKIPAVKSEPVFKVSHKASYRGSQRRGRGGYFSSNRYNASIGSNRFDSGSNPTDSDGNIMKCFKCGSKKHFARFCDKKGEGQKEKASPDNVYVTLLSNSKKLEGLLGESLGTAVLDTACSKTLTGEVWLEEYIETLTEKEKKRIKTSPSETSFVFGDGNQVKSQTAVDFPVKIGRKSAMIHADVVPNQVPLLFSRDSMKKGGVILNTANNSAEVLGEKVKLIQTTSGHLCLPLTNKLLVKECESNIVLNTSAIKECNKEQKYQKAAKLHKQFSHASKEKLIKLVKSSKDFDDPEFIDAIKKCCNECEVCRKFARPPLRPVVTMPLAGEFNQVVSMDLKEISHNKSWILHLIDVSSGFSAARVVYSKKKEEIITKVFECWIAYFGSPQMFLSDNGGEFNNDAYRTMNEQLNIHTATTAGESPFSNGTVERHNSILSEAMKKTMASEKCSAEVALCWAISAKNALPSYGGVSPNMLVFGRNINTPNILIDKPPALTVSTVYDVVRKNINALHTAREKYVEAQSSEKIRKALRSKMRTYTNVNYEPGDKVFYKRKNVKGWKGPATVIGKDGTVVMLRHGGSLVRAHPCHLMKELPVCETQASRPTASHRSRASYRSRKTSRVDERKQRNCDSDTDEGGTDHENVNDIGSDGEQDSSTIESDVEQDSTIESDVEENDSIGASSAVESDEENVNRENAEYNNDDDHENNVENENDVDLLTNTTQPVRNSYVQFKLSGSNEWRSATVLSTLKKTGKYHDWLNVKFEDGSCDCIHWKNVSVWKKLPYPAHVVYLTSEQECSQEVVDAKDKEVQNLIDNKVFKVVPYTGQKTISSKWVFTEKYKQNGEKKVKARIVARGFEENNKNLRKDSPTCSREGLSMVYLSAVTYSWKLESLDFTSAFLQGEAIDRNIFLRPPKDICGKNEVWALQKCLYGLNDAPRSWYNNVKKALLTLGGKQSLFDGALFIWRKEDGKLNGILGMHVDDFVYAGTESFKLEVIEKIKTMFKIGDESGGSFKYVGLSISQNKDGIRINQNDYVSKIEPIKISEKRHPDSELSVEEKGELKRLAGQMVWVSSRTRPDIAYETCIMSNQGSQPTVKMIRNANKAVDKMKKKNISIMYRNVGPPEEIKIKVYSDATHASLSDGSSQGGFVIFIEGNNGRMIPVCWQSKRIQRVTKSPLASETLALGDAADAAFLMASFVREVFGLVLLPPISCVTDSSSLVEHLHTSKVSIDRRLRVDMSRLREMQQNGEISVSWCPGKFQLGDSLTKSTASTSALLKAITS